MRSSASAVPTDFGQRYRHRLAASTNITVVLGANAVEIITDDDSGVVRAIAVKTISGRTFDVKATRFVLATGGLEVPRLLLASRRNHATGIGNGADLVGRTYMCHIAGTYGTLVLDAPLADIWHGYEISEEGIYCRRRLALTPDAQEVHGAGNIVMRLHHPRIPDPAHRTGALSAIYLAKPFIGYEYAKRLHGDDKVSWTDYAAHVKNVATDPFATAGFLLDWLMRRKLAARKLPSVVIRPRARALQPRLPRRAGAQSGEAASRSPTIPTRLGLQKIRIDWRHTERDLATVETAFRLLQKDLRKSGRGQLHFTREGLRHAALRDGAFGGHHVGTTRMGASAATGVVDADARVFGTRNLFVASSAVFPTTSQANPTLTIVAMALRLADHLEAAMKADSEPVVARGRSTRALPCRDRGRVAETPDASRRHIRSRWSARP